MKKNIRTESLKIWSGRIFKVGDKMILHRMCSSAAGVATEISEISPSGKFFKVKGSNESFSIYTLNARGNGSWHGYYVTIHQ